MSSEPPRPSGESDQTSAETRDSSAVKLEGHPPKIGAYAIRRVIASGGMGVVYEAVQDQPRRTVAIKVMRGGVGSPSALRRFEYEAQLLGRLSHPHIAQIYEAGTHQDVSGAVPFFAMEYIPKARPITSYAEEKELPLERRLELFAQVCEAVQHGHQKGIIHRDLKPANILIDSGGQPKIIDFGVARAADSDLAQPGLQTSVGELVGTVQYMSPEQCEADPHDIDTRSDVYALGVVLYELLCGQLPYDVMRVSIHEATRIVREGAIKDPRSANPALPRDVKTIVLKALEKDRERRYESAAGLAQEIRRYLAGDAIEARPASFAYRVRIFARRNRALVWSVGAVVLALAAGLVASTAMYVQARQARAEAENQSGKARAAFNELEKVLLGVDPTKIGDAIKVGDLLDEYGATIGDSLAGEPEIEAMIRTSVGEAYRMLELFEHTGKAEEYRRAAREHLTAALELREKALGEENPETVRSMQNLAYLLMDQDRAPEAERLARRIAHIRQRVLGTEDPKTLEARADLAGIVAEQGRLDEAQTLADDTVATCSNVLGPEHPDTLDSMEQLARLNVQQGRLGEAERIERQVLDARTRAGGEDDRSARASKAALAGILISQGKLGEAADLYHDKPVLEPLRVDRWLKGSAADPEDDPTLLVFWEAWCPFSQRRVPVLEESSRPLRSRGLKIVGISRAQSNGGDQRVVDFAESKGLTFPLAKDDGEIWRYYQIGGTPWAVLAKGGRVLFEGSLSRVTNDVLEGVLDGKVASR